MHTWFFDRYGTPSILLQNSDLFIDSSGRNLGYIYQDKIYNYSGKHVGWIEKGLIRDKEGRAVCFTNGANDFPMPVLPVPQIPPIPSIPQIPPIPAIREIPHIKPVKNFGWSPLDPFGFFN